ncbi:hypothetical protein C7999DRAFT_40515 [Corynascus novoguineensis]|uniref:Uncharacterized protein n=1 Tax=Corynascus novoguineensis TaxID=1126955 RepID=A0AAN7CTQ6_9PEZI|nr:hypothetical protein C7999DRAFT_40515 [Corynascus novoguineensis]
MSVSLDNQTFYNPAAATGRKPASRGPWVRKGGPSVAIFGVPLHPPLLQDVDAILIPSNDEFDDLDGRSDTSFESLDELVLKACKVESRRVTGTGNRVDAASDDSDVPEPSVTSRPGLDGEFANQQQRLAGCAEFGPGPASAADNTSHDATVLETDAASLAEHGATHHGDGMQRSSRPPEKPCGTTSNRDGSICLDIEEEDRRYPFSPAALRRRSQARRAAKSAYNAAEPDPLCRPQESAADLEPVDTEPRLPPQSPCSAASGRGVDPQQGFGSCGLPQHRDHCDDNDQASGPEQRHPLAPDDGGEKNDEEGPTAPPQARESMAGLPTLPDGGGNVDHEPAGASPPMQPPAGRDQAKRVSLQQSNCRRRQRRYDADDEENCSPIAGSDAKRGKDGDVVQPPRGKRCKVNTAPKRQARLRTNSPSQQAQQGPKRRQSQRRVSNPQSSGASALGEETPEAAFASFEEWPLEAVLKRVWVGGAATFQVEFTWNPCTNHGRHERVPENPRRKSPVGGISSSTARTLSLRVASTTEKVQGDEYF